MKDLKIYFTSDLHGYVYPTDYVNTTEKNIGILNIINSFEKDDNTLIIDGGDTIQGSPFTNYLSNTDFDVHPIATIFNEGQYDFVTLGNHDFNYGKKYLKKYFQAGWYRGNYFVPASLQWTFFDVHCQKVVKRDALF